MAGTTVAVLGIVAIASVLLKPAVAGGALLLGRAR